MASQQPTPPAAAASSAAAPGPRPKASRWMLGALRLAVFVVSALLIVFISLDSFAGRDFLQNRIYMRFQFWACIFFIIDFFIELAFAPSKRSYLRTHWLFLILSIPFLNIITRLQIPVSTMQLDWVRFLPLGRAAMAMAIVVGYISRNKATSLLASYALILLAFGYFGSLIFFDAEHGVNPLVNTYWDALWWASMDVTTIGCNIEPVTLVGKIVAVVTGCMGVLMLPLFTVYITSLVQRNNKPAQ